jgi:iron complex transport system substrate-binding protein
LAKKSEVNKNNLRVIKSENFKIIHHSSYIELQIIAPEKGKIERSYALIPRGKSPIISNPTTVKIQVPIKGLITLSATQLGMLKKLHELKCVKGVSNERYIDNPQVIQQISLGKTKEFESIDQLNPERVFVSGANVVLYDGFGKAPVNEDKLAKLGVYCIPNYDWRESSPLGKAEWIKVLGVLTGKEQFASDYFAKISKEYKLLVQEVKKSHVTRKYCLLGSLIGDRWYMPAGESYMATILKDAGINYVEKNSRGTGSVSFTLEHCLTHYKNASYWINPGCSSKKELLQQHEKYRYFKAFQSNNLFCYSHNPNYFWENSAIEPHHLLSDFIQLNRGKYSDKKLYFYRKLKE